MKPRIKSHHKRLEMVPAAMILLLLFTTCFYYAGYRPSGYALIHIIVLISLCISMALNPKKYRRIPRSVILSLAGFLLYAVVNYLWKGCSAKGTDILVLWFDLVAVAWIVIRTPRKHLEPLLALWFAGSIVVSFIHFYYVLSASETHPFPPHMKHGYHYGFYAVLVIFSGLGMYLSKRKFKFRLIALSACIVSFVYLVVDIKTSPILGAGSGFILSLFLMTRKDVNGQRFIILIVFALSLLVSAFCVQDFMFKDLRTHIVTREIEEAHTIPMGTALRTGINNPVTGAGLGNFEFVSGLMEPPGLRYQIIRAHNSLLELFSELGTIGIVLLGLLLFFLMRELQVKNHRHVLSYRVRRGIYVSLIAAGILSILDFGLQMPANALAVVFLLAMLFSDSLHSEIRSTVLRGPKRFVWILPLLFLPCGIVWGAAAFWSEQATVYRSRAQFLTAVYSLERAHRFRKHDDRILSSLGLSTLDLASLTGNKAYYDSADQYLKIALTENPIQADIWYARASLEMPDNLDPGTNRITFLKEAVRLDPNNLTFSLGLMATYSQMDDFDGVFRELKRKIIHLHRKDIRKLTAAFLRIREDPEDIIPRLIAFAPEMPLPVAAGFASNLLQRKYPADAVVLLENVFETRQDDFLPEDWLTVARLLKQSKSYSIARDVCEAGLQHVIPETIRIDLMKLKLQIFLQEGLYEDARVQIADLKLLQPDDLAIRIDEITCVRHLVGDDMELRMLLELVREFPRKAKAHQVLAKALEQRGEIRLALDEYRLAHSLSGGEYQKQIDAGEKRLGIDPFWQ